jgi:hypothetical protein
VPVSKITPLGIALRIKANNYNCSRVDSSTCFGGRCPLRSGPGSCGVSSPRDTKGYARRVSLIDAYIAANSPKVKSVNLRPNFVKALKNRIHIRVDTSATVAKELQEICLANGVIWYSGKALASCNDGFFIRHTNKGYCMVLGGDGTLYRPETDTFDRVIQVESPKTESYPNLREALKDKKRFFVKCTPEFFVQLHPILEELDVPRFKVENKIVWTNPIVFAFTYMGNHPSTYCLTAIIDKGIVTEYFPETDSFDSAEKVAVTSVSSEDVVIAKKTCKNCTRFDLVNGECPLTHNVSLGFVCNEWTDKPIEKVEEKKTDLGMTGKCCDNTNLSLTIGKQYAVIAVTASGFKIRDDLGCVAEYAKERFESIESVEISKEMRISSPARNEGKYFMLNLDEKAASNLKKLLDSNPGKLGVHRLNTCQSPLPVKVPEYVWVVVEGSFYKRKSASLTFRVVEGVLSAEMYNEAGDKGFFNFYCSVDEAYASFKAGENK